MLILANISYMLISFNRIKMTNCHQGWWVTGGLVPSPEPLDPFSVGQTQSSSSVNLTTTAATELLEFPSNPDQSFVEGPDLPFALHKHCALQIATGWAETINLNLNSVSQQCWVYIMDVSMIFTIQCHNTVIIILVIMLLIIIMIRLSLVIGGVAPTSPPSTLATSLLYNWTSQSWWETLSDHLKGRLGAYMFTDMIFGQYFLFTHQM